MRRIGLVTSAAVAYLVAAWMVAPGFYDGFVPLQPYNWVCPPIHITSNKPALAGHFDIKVIGGVSDGNVAFTDDGQAVIDFLPGGFDATGKTSISVDIKPVDPCPKPPGLTFATNVYLISADAPVAKKAHLILRYSDIVPAPSNVYYAASAEGPWTGIGALSESQPFTIDATIDKLGYYAAGYPTSSVSHGGASSQLLPIAIAILIIGVLVAGIPLAIMRRRSGSVQPEEEDDAG